MRVRPIVLVFGCLFTLIAVPTASPRTAAASVPYVIVTDASLAAAFAPLAAAHSAAGLTAEVHTVQDIAAAYPVAADDAERIRKFLIDAHANLGTKFVLLGGDDPLVPSRRAFLRLSASTGQPDRLLATDQYYACLDGTWNADGDANWGELPYPALGEAGDDMDFVPDIAVGRAPVGNLAQAHAFVAKSMAALAAQDGARPISVLMAANALFVGTPTVIDLAGTMEELLPILAAHPGTHVARLYQLSANWPGSFPENRQSVLDSLNQGYDVALLNGQGGPGQFQAGNYPADLVNAAEFGALTNATPTFAFFMSAYTTLPGPGMIGAAWINDAAGGATSVIGTTDVQFISIGNAFMREFLHQAFELHVPTQGEALAATIQALPFSLTETTRLTTQGNLLLGDPALAWPGSLEGGTTPTLLSLVDSETSSGVARLSWYASDAPSAGALVERRTDGSDWQALGAPVERGDGLFTYEDHVEAGGRFAYRLRLADGAVSAEVWLTIPGVEGLHLAGFAPNPSVGALRVAFSLPSAAPATIEVVNVAGRRIARRDVGALGAGEHVIELAGDDRPAPGVYWIRLAQGARVLVTRGVRLQ
jgi:hypothetical protein